LVYFRHLLADVLFRVQKPIDCELSGIQLRIPLSIVLYQDRQFTPGGLFLVIRPTVSPRVALSDQA